jgi:hypothetical protein
MERQFGASRQPRAVNIIRRSDEIRHPAGNADGTRTGPQRSASSGAAAALTASAREHHHPG